jgi:two-component system, NarL family, sensor histidine kinase EvgS
MKILITLLLFFTFGLANEKVSIQLKWTHSFQFAGYYAALHEGYFKNEGLDVTLLEGGIGKESVAFVTKKDGHYGVHDGSLLLHALRGKEVSLVAQIFQHSPLIFMAKSSSGIIGPYEMIGKRVSFNHDSIGDITLNALISDTLEGLNKVKLLPFYGDKSYEKFEKGEIDVIVGYSSDQPFAYKERGIDVTQINPQNYGIDFYGDNLFTSRSEYLNHPKRVQKVKRAILKGWEYALQNPEKIIELLKSKYKVKNSLKALEFEAKKISKMILREHIILGSFKKERYAKVAEIYKRLGFIKSTEVDDMFWGISESKKLLLSIDEELWLSNNRTFNFHFQEYMLPYAGTENGKTVGMLKDLLDLLNRKLDAKFELKLFPINDVLKGIKEGTLPAGATAARYKTLKNNYNFTPVIAEVSFGAFSLFDTKSIMSADELKKYRVIANTDTFAVKQFLNVYPDIKMQNASSNSEMFEKLRSGEVDIVYTEVSNGRYHLAKKFKTDVKVNWINRGHNREGYFIISKKYPHLHSIMVKALNAITDRERSTLFNKWFFNDKVDLFNEQERAWIYKHPNVLVGAEEGWGPFSIKGKNGEYKGLVKDYLDLISKKSGLTFKGEWGSWNAIEQKIKNRSVDIIPTAYYDEGIKDKVIFSKQYLSLIDYFFIHKDIKAETFDDLKGLTVAIPKGYFEIELIKKEMPHIKVLETEDLSDAISKVRSREADLLFDAYAVLSYRIQKEKINDIVAFKTNPFNQISGIHFITRSDQPVLASIIEKSLASMSEKEKAGILKKWVGNSSSNIQEIDLSITEEKWIENHPVLNFTGDPKWLPFEAFSENGEYLGIVSEYLKLIEKRLGIKIETLPVKNWKEAIDMAQGNHVEIISASTANKRLYQSFVPIKPYLHTPIVIATRDNDTFINNLNELKGQTIALINNYGYTNDFLTRYPELDFALVEDINEGLEGLSIGKYDALLGNLSVMSYAIKKRGLHQIKIVGKTDEQVSLTLFTTKDQPILNGLIQKVFESISQEEQLKISALWNNQEFSQDIDLDFALKILIALIVIIVVIIYVNRKLVNEIRLRRIYEDELLAEKENFESLFQTTSDGNLIIQDGQFVLCNSAALAMLGVVDEKDLLYTYPEVWSPKLQADGENSAKKVQKIIHKVLQTGSDRFEWIHHTIDKEPFWVDVVLTKIVYKDRDAIYVVWRDKSEQKELEHSLQASRDEAEAANKSKSEFLANMSHEIRAPMNAVVGFTELLSDTTLDVMQQNYLQSIKTGSKNLLSIINDILDLSKIEAGKLSIDKLPMNVHTLAQELEQLFMINAQNKGLKLSIDISKDIPVTIFSDEVRMRQILFNLIGNAIKFTEKGFINVVFNATLNEEKMDLLDLEVAVSDSGIGIPPEEHENVFEIFEQQEGQNSRKFGGTGLGLSISSKLSNKLGGHLSLQSEVGKGSTFTLSIPDMLYSREYRAEEYDDHKVYEFKPATILVVDDITDNRELIKGIYKKQPFTILEAANGEEALNQCETNPNIALILMDIRMPVMDGFEAVKHLKENSLTLDIPVVAVTASVLQSEHQRIMDSGFVALVQKPIKKELLSGTIASYLDCNKEITVKEEKSSLDNNLITVDDTILTQYHEKFDSVLQQQQHKNNFNDIKVLAQEIVIFSIDYEVVILQDKANALLEAVSVFDIEKIRMYLNELLLLGVQHDL